MTITAPDIEEWRLKENADPATVALLDQRNGHNTTVTPGQADQPAEPDHFDGASDLVRLLRPGGTFVLDGPAEVEIAWGHGDQIGWAVGEPLLIAGPTGVGKTTVALQLVAGRLGLIDDFLGLPVKPDDRPVLYLALDRPQQIRRAMRRIFGEEHRQILDKRLKMWAGPLPADLGKRPRLLLDVADAAGAGTVVIDSLKDAAVKLADDEAGGNLNRAIQHVIADGREVLSLHHQRKGQNGTKPNTLEDVYGSTWLTAGAGSVFLLWGAAGDPIVELRHVKQPADEIGPLKIEHDHDAGRSIVSRGQADPIAVIRNAGSVTATQLAQIWFEVEPNDNQRKKAQRKLDKLARDGILHKVDSVRAGQGGVVAARYHLADRYHETQS